MKLSTSTFLSFFSIIVRALNWLDAEWQASSGLTIVLISSNFSITELRYDSKIFTRLSNVFAKLDKALSSAKFSRETIYKKKKNLIK